MLKPDAWDDGKKRWDLQKESEVTRVGPWCTELMPYKMSKECCLALTVRLLVESALRP